MTKSSTLPDNFTVRNAEGVPLQDRWGKPLVNVSSRVAWDHLLRHHQPCAAYLLQNGRVVAVKPGKVDA